MKNYDVVLIPGKYTAKITMPKEVIDRLPKKLIIFSSVQFLDQLPSIQKQLQEKGIHAVATKSKNHLYEGLITDAGQLLGCNMENFVSKQQFDAFLYIGDGVFHPKALLVNNEKDVYCYDPKNDKLNVLDKSMHQEYARRIKGAKLKFLTSRTIGLLVTTKMGQGSYRRANKLKDLMAAKWPERKIFIFYADEINFGELENFNFIDIYVNVACSRIGHDDITRSEKPIINIIDAETILKEIK